jgi:hypothetical protein
MLPLRVEEEEKVYNFYQVGQEPQEEGEAIQVPIQIKDDI